MKAASAMPAPSLASLSATPAYSHSMTPPSSPLRRSLAALAAICVLFAPETQLAHAQAMAHDAAQHGAAPAMHHHMAPAPHGSRHQHGDSCCDLCPAGCQTVALPPPMAGLAAIIASHAFGVATAGQDLVVQRSQHVLPFSLAPPLLSA
jgi:hypothetical protein